MFSNNSQRLNDNSQFLSNSQYFVKILSFSEKITSFSTKILSFSAIIINLSAKKISVSYNAQLYQNWIFRTVCTETILQQGLVKVRCIVWNTKCFLWRSIYLSSLACAFLHTFLHFENFLFSSGCYVIFASHVGYCSLGYFGIGRILFTNEKISLASLATRLSCQHVFQLSSICCIGEKFYYIV